MQKKYDAELTTYTSWNIDLRKVSSARQSNINNTSHYAIVKAGIVEVTSKFDVIYLFLYTSLFLSHFIFSVR